VARSAAVATGAYLAYVFVQGSRRLVHPQVRPFMPEDAGAPGNPGDLGIAFEDVSFTADDGVRLSGWLIPAARETRAAVVLMHGFTGHRLPELAAFVPWLHKRYHILQFDFRGHGDSDPGLVTFGAVERHDVAAAVRHLQERGCGPIALMGVSMGAAIALVAAPDLPVSAVVADAPFAHLHHPIANRVREFGYPLPRIGARLIVLGAQLRARRRLPSPIDTVARIAPRGLLLITGREDRLIGWRQAVELYEAAGEPKELHIVDGAGHAESWAYEAAEYEQRVLAFLERFLDGAQAAGVSAPAAEVSAPAAEVRVPAAEAEAGTAAVGGSDAAS
jgi:alpha-beta hydrolase superfamily lysophospholipase